MVSDIDSKFIDKMHRSSQAEKAKDYLDLILEEKKNKVIGRLCSMYRESKMEFPVICGLLGELTLIEDTASRTERDINQGRQIEGKLYNAT
jgi:hypothetical protein